MGGGKGNSLNSPGLSICPSRWTRANEDERGSKSASGYYDRETRPKNGVVIDKNMRNRRSGRRSSDACAPLDN